MAEPLRRCLQADEVILYICQGNSPMNFLEQWSFGYVAYTVCRCALVLTNKRLLALRMTASNNAWTGSIREVAWSDVREAKVVGWLSGYVNLSYRNGKTERYWALNGNDKGKLKLLLPKLLEESRSEAAGTGEMHASCPECFAALQAKVYECPKCGLVFKAEKEVYWRALVPSLAYIFTNHPVLAVVDGLGEAVGLLILATGILGVAQGDPESLGILIAGVIIFGLDYIVCVAHNIRFAREFLPTKEHHMKSGMGAVAGH